MSDRVYTEVNEHAGAGVAAGVFPKSIITAAGQPADTETLIIKGVGGSPELALAFSDTTGADHRKLHNGINNSTVLIGNTLSETYNNISTAVNTHDNLTQVGKANTLTVSVSGNINTAYGVVVWTNEKVAGNNADSTTGTWNSNHANLDTGVAVTGLYSTYDSYTGIMKHGGSDNVDVLMLKSAADDYNIGPPTNPLKKVTIYMTQGVIYPIRTFGASEDVRAFR